MSSFNFLGISWDFFLLFNFQEGVADSSLHHTLVHKTKKMVLSPFFDIPSDFQPGKILQECPFLGQVFFDLSYFFGFKNSNQHWLQKMCILLLPDFFQNENASCFKPTWHFFQIFIADNKTSSTFQELIAVANFRVCLK